MFKGAAEGTLTKYTFGAQPMFDGAHVDRDLFCRLRCSNVADRRFYCGAARTSESASRAGRPGWGDRVALLDRSDGSVAAGPVVEHFTCRDFSHGIFQGISRGSSTFPSGDSLSA